MKYVNQLSDDELREIYSLFLCDGGKVVSLEITRCEDCIDLDGYVKEPDNDNQFETEDGFIEVDDDYSLMDYFVKTYCHSGIDSHIHVCGRRKYMDNISCEEVIGCLENLKSDVSFDDNRKSLDIAIREVGKCIPQKPINNGNWSAKTCPTCGMSLSEHRGDGYYVDSICLDSCPECRQLLDWD